MRAIERGVDVKVIAEWQGHRDGGRVILQTYSHVNRPHSERMARLMSDDEPENVILLHEINLDSHAAGSDWVKRTRGEVERDF